jgi:uncharacterized protein YpmS
MSLKKGLLLFITTVLLILGLISIFAYSISPKVKFAENTKDKETLNYIVGKKVLSSLGAIITEKKVEFDFEFSERELNDILYWQKEKINSKKEKLKGLHCKVEKGSFTFYVDTKLLAMPAQFIIKTKPVLSEDKISFALEEIYMGRLKLPKGWVLSYIEKNFRNLKVDKENETITASTELPKQLIISDFAVEDEVQFKLTVSVKSKLDFIGLAAYLYPKDYKEIIKDIIFD